MALNRINSDSIANNTVIAADILDGTITTAKLSSTAYGDLTITANTASATANSGAIYANGAFAQANTAASTGKAIAMSIVFG